MCIPDPGYSAGSKGIVMVLSALYLALAASIGEACCPCHVDLYALKPLGVGPWELMPVGNGTNA